MKPSTLLQKIRIRLEMLRTGAVSAYAAQAAFFILLSLIPFFLFLLSLLQYLPSVQDRLFPTLLRFLPERALPFMQYLFSELDRQPSLPLLSFSAVFAVWSAGRGTLSVIEGLNHIAGEPEGRSYFRLWLTASFYTLLFALALLLIPFFSMLSFLNDVHLLPPFAAAWFLEFLLLFLFFLSVYHFLPSKGVPWNTALPGAFFAASAWVLFSVLFSFYTGFSGSFSVYGSLSSLIVLMLWLYISICILFVGAQLNEQDLRSAKKRHGNCKQQSKKL